ncbi:hypothetical protein BGZ51_004832 [Haplosporangium sp. Z 767]|nr:hypothetical protein BGZ51_004832 [Haplosporangium sp. Z 767]
MREQDFGADPLEAFGGFRTLSYDPKAKYPSELAKNGVVGWHTTETDADGWVHILYPEIDWKFNQQFLGWTFNQYQAWARSSFTVSPTATCVQSSPGNSDGLCSVTVQCKNVGDFYVDNERLSGDWYGYGLTRHTLRLAPGTQHTISVRVVHEVRIFGGVILPPPSKFKCTLEMPFSRKNQDQQDNAAHEPMVQVVEEGYGGCIVMDNVDGVLAGEYISVALRNVGPNSVLIKSVKVLHGSNRFTAELADTLRATSLFPSVHRPIAVRLKQKDEGDDFYTSKDLEFTLAFELEGDGVAGTVTTNVLKIEWRTWGEAYKYTFLDFDGTVHYAAAIPPSKPISQTTGSAPVLVSLHGAGVEVAQSPFWLSEYTQRERTWRAYTKQVILPGSSLLSRGYDWHGASIKNVFTAIQSLADHLHGVPNVLKDVPGMKPDPERLLMAVTPAAGYVNIKQYVPYSTWLSNSYTDAHLRGLLEASITEFDNDVHMSNTVGIPILARTGGADDNVPPFNSRRMVRLGQENGHNLSAISLSEVPGAGHWFTGVLHDDIMQAFLKEHLQDDTVSQAKEGATIQGTPVAVVHPPFPKSFEIIVLNPAGMGSKGGVQVEQLRVPFRKGTIKVKILETMEAGEPFKTWIVNTTNVRRFRILGLSSLRLRRGSISRLIVDGVTFDLDTQESIYPGIQLHSGTFLRDSNASKSHPWQFTTSNDWVRTERHRETYGPAIQILEKRVVVVLGTRFSQSTSQSLDGSELKRTAERIAKLIAHDIYLYGRSDVEIITDNEYLERLKDVSDKSNLVLIGDAHQNQVTRHILAQTEQEVSIDTQRGWVTVEPKSDNAFESVFRQHGTGLLMLRPWGPSNLAMIIAGLDQQGMETAAWLFPKRTGLLIPDWAGPEMAWKGAGGILAAGYWGNQWEYQSHMST